MSGVIMQQGVDPRPRQNPWAFIPALYFMQGVPVILMTYLLPVLYFDFGLPNRDITLWTSLVTIPWGVKLFWAPLVDLHGTKRRWFQVLQILLIFALVAAAASLSGPYALVISLVVWGVLAILSATHDIALDGYYLLALKKEEQAFFTGIRSAAFRGAWFFVTFGLAAFAGYLRDVEVTSKIGSWQYAILLGAGVCGIVMLYGFLVTPSVPSDGPAAHHSWDNLLQTFGSFFAQPRVMPVIAVMLFYRLPEAMLTKLSGVFLQDTLANGGLGYTLSDYARIQGVVGIIALLLGGILGGIVISQYGIRRTMWPIAILMSVPNLPYVWAAYTHPDTSFIYVITALEQFGYGIGMSWLLIYVMARCREPYKASHYAIGTSFMYGGLLLAGIPSGAIQEWLGYTGFFTAVCLVSVPCLLLLFFIPLDDVP